MIALTYTLKALLFFVIYFFIGKTATKHIKKNLTLEGNYIVYVPLKTYLYYKRKKINLIGWLFCLIYPFFYIGTQIGKKYYQKTSSFEEQVCSWYLN